VTPQPTRAARDTAPDASPDPEAPGRLDRDLLVAATVSLVDSHGVARFTMRMLGEELGRSAMASYRHVANKDELVALAADAVLAGVEIPVAASGTPRERLRELTQNAFLQLAAHPWVAPFLLTYVRSMPNADQVHREMVAILSEVEPNRERARLGAGAVRAYLIGWLAGYDGDKYRSSGTPGPGPGPSAAARAQFDFGLDAMIVGILVSLS
jgi:AcrR family transcriptional regulator